jgi:hypothetical protein
MKNPNRANSQTDKFNEAKKQYINSRDQYNDFLIRDFKAFANLGWYISTDMNSGALNNLVELIKTGHTEPVNSFFIAHYGHGLNKHFAKIGL